MNLSNEDKGIKPMESDPISFLFPFVGNAGADTLSGGGGAGDDTYIVSSLDDAISEAANNATYNNTNERKVA